MKISFLWAGVLPFSNFWGRGKGFFLSSETSSFINNNTKSFSAQIAHGYAQMHITSKIKNILLLKYG